MEKMFVTRKAMQERLESFYSMFENNGDIIRSLIHARLFELDTKIPEEKDDEKIIKLEAMREKLSSVMFKFCLLCGDIDTTISRLEKLEKQAKEM